MFNNYTPKAINCISIMIFRVYVVNSVNKKSIAHFLLQLHWLLVSKYVKRFTIFNQQRLHIFLVKNASPDSVASFVLDAIEFFFYRVHHFSGNIDKTRGSHFEIQCPCYNYLVRGDYSQVWLNPQPIRACASL